MKDEDVARMLNKALEGFVAPVTQRHANEYQRIMEQLAKDDATSFDFAAFGERTKWVKDPYTGIAKPEDVAPPNPWAGITESINLGYWSAPGTDLSTAPSTRMAGASYFKQLAALYGALVPAPSDYVEPPPLCVDPVVKTEVVYGYRSFIVSASQNLSLRAVANAIEYPRFHRMVATCTQTTFNASHKAPEANCTCGVYAVRDAKQASKTGGSIFAKVALWGRIIVCASGYRAQYAYPQTLYLTGKNDEVVRAVAPLYGCSVEKMP